MDKGTLDKGRIMTAASGSKGAGRHQSVSAPHLEVRSLSQAFGAMLAVNNLSFEVYPGEVFGIAGPNGSGKTTLFNVITGFLPGTGEVLFEGSSINSLKPHQICRKGIARTFQIPLVFSTLDVFHNVRFGAHFGNPYPKNENQIIHDAIDFVGLTGKKAVVAENVDLLHKKLIMIAAALATHPKLLLLDEPIGGLSPPEIGPLIKLIQRINEELGIAIIVIEHLMKALKELSHRLMILHYGEMIRIGDPEEVMDDNKVREVYLG
jgi:branched-chain amino acid transport system ATP-binding protein